MHPVSFRGRWTKFLVVLPVFAVAACGHADEKSSGVVQVLSTVTSPPKPIEPPDVLDGMLPNPSDDNIYAAAGPNMLADVVKDDLPRVYVPNLRSNDVYVIDPATFGVVDVFPGGNEPQHVVPDFDLQTLYVAADIPGASSLTPIDPNTGKPGPKIFVDDPYNLYFTPDGKYGVVVAEAYKRLDFFDRQTWQWVKTINTNCPGIDHLDFTADGKMALASCEFSGRMAVIDIEKIELVREIDLPGGRRMMPQDTRLSPDGKTFYTADMVANGIYLFDAATMEYQTFIYTGAGAHGLYFTRDSERLLVTNRHEGSISVFDWKANKEITKWWIPGGGSPDMGALSADGNQFWVSGRHHNEVYVIDTNDGRLIAKIPVGTEPHGLLVWPQPGRYSLGHTGTLR